MKGKLTRKEWMKFALCLDKAVDILYPHAEGSPQLRDVMYQLLKARDLADTALNSQNKPTVMPVVQEPVQENAPQLTNPPQSQILQTPGVDYNPNDQLARQLMDIAQQLLNGE